LPLSGLAVWFWHLHDAREDKAPDRLMEKVKLLSAATQSQQIEAAQDSPAMARLTQAINALAAERDRWRSDVQAQVAQANQSLQQERNRLAALMSELTQSVVVCNLDGRILLYNNQARWQSRALSGAVGGGVELMGLGRSIYGVFDRKLVAHALENIQARMSRGAASPSARARTAQ
jgi:DNA polymerase-3 subunit epsilon